MEYKEIKIPSNLPKVFCVDVLRSCNIGAKFIDLFSSLNNHAILVEDIFLDQAKIILDQCSIVKAREWLKK